MKHFASYEKNIESTVVNIKHTVRILLNSNRRNIEDALKNVPYNANVVLIIGDPSIFSGDDEGTESYGEIVFNEET